MTIRAQRRAVTLVEVLIAIFLMGIGLMAILSLFPLGAAQMAQALKDQRCAEAATNATAMARVMWKQACDEDLNSGLRKFYDSAGNPSSYQAFVRALDNPNFDVPPPPSTLQIQTQLAIPRNGVAATGPSYPVFLDPIGWQSNSVNPARKWWLPTVPVNGFSWAIPRRTLNVRQTTASPPIIDLNSLGFQRVFKQFSLTDDMTFKSNGTPDTGTTGNVDRQGRYSWAYLLRRRNNMDRTNVDISVVVYSGRSIDVPSPETAFVGTAADAKTLQLAYSGAKPAIRRGGWILDATLTDTAGGLAPQGIFYRVVNIDDSAAGLLTLELQTPLLGGPPAGSPRAIVVMDNVVEVFTRTDVTNVAPPMPY